jgi:hypothetical protein
LDWIETKSGIQIESCMNHESQELGGICGSSTQTYQPLLKYILVCFFVNVYFSIPHVNIYP